jgi:hypothetical protein
MRIQAAEQSEQDDTVFRVLEPFKHRSKDKHYLAMRQTFMDKSYIFTIPSGDSLHGEL